MAAAEKAFVLAEELGARVGDSTMHSILLAHVGVILKYLDVALLRQGVLCGRDAPLRPALELKEAGRRIGW